MTKFPNWYSKYSPPAKPDRPPEKVFIYEQVFILNIAEDKIISFSAGESDHISIEAVNIDYYGDSSFKDITLKFSKKKEVPNPNYQAQYAKYLEDLATYEIRTKEWKKLKLEDEEREKEHRRKQYEKLRNEFEC